MKIKTIFQKINSLIFPFVFGIVGLAFFISSIRLSINNIINPRNFKEGIVIKNIFREHTTSTITQSSNESIIKILNKKQINKQIISSRNIYELKVGDTVMVRHVGTVDNNIVFKVNGKTVGRPYDEMDKLAPFLSVILGFILYRYMVVPIFLKIRKRQRGF